MTAQGPERDTYLSLGRHLYEVIEWVGDGDAAKLRVRNCRTMHDVSLTAAEVELAVVVTPSTDEEFVIPAEWAAA